MFRSNLSKEQKKEFDGSAQQLSILPKLYIGLTKRGHVAFSFGPEIPIAGEKPFKHNVVAFFLWEYADGGLF